MSQSVSESVSDKVTYWAVRWQLKIEAGSNLVEFQWQYFTHIMWKCKQKSDNDFHDRFATLLYLCETQIPVFTFRRSECLKLSISHWSWMCEKMASNHICLRYNRTTWGARSQIQLCDNVTHFAMFVWDDERSEVKYLKQWPESHWELLVQVAWG